MAANMLWTWRRAKKESEDNFQIWYNMHSSPVSRNIISLQFFHSFLYVCTKISNSSTRTHSLTSCKILAFLQERNQMLFLAFVFLPCTTIITVLFFRSLVLIYLSCYQKWNIFSRKLLSLEIILIDMFTLSFQFLLDTSVCTVQQL